METKHFGSPKQILAIVEPKVAIGAVIGDTGVTANEQGRKIIPAGTPVGGEASTLDDSQAVLTVSNDAKAQGVLEHDVDVTNGTTDGTLIIFGFVNENRLDDSLTISPEAKTALNGKVTFMKRN